MKSQPVVVAHDITIDAPLEAAWSFIRNPQLLSRCIPGVSSVTENSDGSFSVLVEITLSLLKARFDLEVQILEEAPPDSIVASIEGAERLTGSNLEARNRMQLNPSDRGTELSFTIDAAISGKLAALGGGSVIKLTSRKMARAFADRVRQQLEEQTTRAE